MFQITAALATRLCDEVRAQPLAPGEVRRIVGLGGHYLVREDTLVIDQVLHRFCTLTIDDTTYAFCVRGGE